MSDIKTESAEFVVAHLLTKSGTLSTNDTRVLQTGLIETKNAGFDAANGNFGVGTAKGIMGFLSKNLDVVPRLSDATKQALSGKGHEAALNDLTQKAMDSGYDPSSIEGDTIESLIAQPYPLSQEEMKHLQTELHAAGHYKLDGNEFTKYADGSPTKIHPNGEMGASTAYGVLSYIENKNPEAVLENPSITGYMTKQGEHYQKPLREAAQDSAGYSGQVKELIENNTGTTMSTTNYKLQQMLQSGGYTLSAPDGEVGGRGQDAIKAFEKDQGANTASLTCAWENKDSPETWACNQPKPDGVDAALNITGQSLT